jgi:hypothetical protein
MALAGVRRRLAPRTAEGVRGFVAVPKMSADRDAQPFRNNYL